MLNRLVFVMLALIAMPLTPAAAQTQPWTQIGSLVCKVDPNVGFIFVGHQPMQCTFTPTASPTPPQYYDGAINTVGIDIGVSAGSMLGWGVFAPTTGVANGALAREYIGASGDLGLGIGAGANVLVGGSARTRASATILARVAGDQCRARGVVAQATPGHLEIIRP